MHARLRFLNGQVSTICAAHLFLLIILLGTAPLGFSIAHADETPSVESTPVESPDPAAERPIPLPDFPKVPEGPPVAHILRVKDASKRIAGLELVDSATPVALIAQGADIKPTVALRGRFNRVGWTLTAEADTTPLTGPGTSEFTVYAHLRGRVNQIDFVATGPNKARETERVYLYAPNAKSFHVVSAWDDLLFSTGLAYMSYRQSGFGNYQAIDVLADVQYTTSDSESLFGFTSSVDMTIFALVTSPIATSPQLFEAKADLTLRTRKGPLKRDRSRFLAGVTYLTMFANGSPFGFADLAAPEFGFYNRRVVNATDDWIFQFRFAPIGGLTNIDQRAVNVSLTRSRLLANSRRFEMGVAYSGYAFKPEEAITISSTVISFRVGITF